MKHISKITALNICLLLSQTQSSHAFFNDEFEQEFIEKMNHFEKSMEDTKKNINAQLKQFHDQFFHDFDARSKYYHDYANQQDLMGNQNQIRYYQQTSSSLSFANNDKAIKIIEQKDDNTKTYTIIVTDKKADEAAMQNFSNQELDIPDELQELTSYIKKNFNSKPAEKILEECIKAMAEEHKDSLMNIKSSVNGNQKKYTVEIAHKKEPVVADAAPTKKNKKNKNSYNPRKN